MSHFNFYSILFNSQTRQQGNSPLALRPLRRSYQVLLCPIKQKWIQTYSRLKTLTSVRLLYCNTKWTLLSQLFIFISEISSKEQVWCDTLSANFFSLKFIRLLWVVFSSQFEVIRWNSGYKFFFSFNFSVRILLRYF